MITRRMLLAHLSLAALVCCPPATAPAADAGRAADPTKLHIGIAFPMVVPADIEGNIRRMEPLVEEAAKQGARVVCFSECSINGYDLHDRGLATAFAADAEPLRKVAEMAARHGVVLLVGFFERDGGKVYNSAAAVYPDGRKVVQRKFQAGEVENACKSIACGPRERQYFDIDGFKCAMLICADSGAKQIQDDMRAAGCDVVFGLYAGAGSVSFGFYQIELETGYGRRKYFELEAEQPHYPKPAVEDALRHRICQVAVNQRGWVPEMGYFHPGCGYVVDWTGQVTAAVPGRFIFEHLRPEVAVGWVTKPVPKPQAR